MEYFRPNPFLMNPVLDCLFEFVDGKSLQQCRLVCRTWISVCEESFLKKSMLKVTEKNVEKLDKSLLSRVGTSAASLFPTIRRPVSFTSFKFDISLLDKRGCERKYFFLRNKSKIKHLVINNIQDSEELVSRTTKGMVNSLLPPSLKRLTFNGHAKFTEKKGFIGGTPLTISLSKLCRIPYLDFRSCAIVFEIDSRIEQLTFETKEFNLVDCYIREGFLGDPPFLWNCEPLKHLNRIINFSSVQKIHIRSGDLNTRHSDLVIHFRDIENVKYITLVGMLVHIDETISPDELILINNKYNYFRGRIPLLDYIKGTKMTKMEIVSDRIGLNFEKYFVIEKLKLESGNIEEIVDISPQCGPYMDIIELKIEKSEDILFLRILPQSVQQLDIWYSQYSIVSERVPKLPNLKSLLLRYQDKVFSMTNFTQSPKLVDLALKCSDLSEDIFVIEDWLAIGIKRPMFLDEHPVAFMTGFPIQLDVLAFGNSNLWQFLDDKVFEAFRPYLVLFCDYDYDKAELKHINESHVHAIYNLKDRILPNVAFGPVKWGDEKCLKNKYLLSIFDQSGEYYLYNGKTAAVILEAEFIQTIPLFRKNVQWYA